MSAAPSITPDPSFDEAMELQRFWDAHYAELLATYPEQFVAVKDGRVVATNTDLALLVYELRDHGIDARTDVAIQFITAKSGSLLL
jgi:hypothetical protein